MISLNTSETGRYSNDFHAWVDRVNGLCGRYQADHEGSELKWLVEESSSVDQPGCTRLINNCSHMFRTQEDVRSDQNDFFFLVLQLEGHSVMAQSDGIARLAPGDLTLLDSARSSHFYFGIENSVSDQLSLIIPRDRLQRIFKHDKVLTGKTIAANAFATQTISHLVRQIHAQSAPSRLHQDALLESILCLLRPGLAQQPASPAEDIRSSNDKLLKKAVHIIETLLDNPDLSPTIVADQMGTSVRNLHRMFAQHLSTPIRYIIERRLEHCAQRLRDDEETSISTIALDCGFADLSHFSRSFKSRFGTTAREYRKQFSQHAPHRG